MPSKTADTVCKSSPSPSTSTSVPSSTTLTGFALEGYTDNEAGKMETYSGGAYLSSFCSEANKGDGVHLSIGNSPSPSP